MMKGKLTYVTAGVALAYGLIGFLFGFGDPDTNIQTILLGSGLFGLRRAM